jgi:hypothetical protein
MTPAVPNDPDGARAVRVAAGSATLEGTLAVPRGARGVVLFAHGSGSGRHSPRNRYVAAALGRGGLATLLVDLLTTAEELIDERTRHLRFDIGLLADRLAGRSSGSPRSRRRATSPSACSARAPAAARRSSPRRGAPIACARWCRAADARTSPATRCPSCARRRCWSWAGATSR